MLGTALAGIGAPATRTCLPGAGVSKAPQVQCQFLGCLTLGGEGRGKGMERGRDGAPFAGVSYICPSNFFGIDFLLVGT